jgi:hypothetical protein
MVAIAPAAAAGKLKYCSTAGEVDVSGQLCRPSASGKLAWGAKYRILYYGDSLAAETASYVLPLLTAHSRAKVVDRSGPGSSPCDWRLPLGLDLGRAPADGVMIEFFGNNISRCQLNLDGTRNKSEGPLYWERYEADARETLARFAPATPVWIAAAPSAWNDMSSGASHKGRMLTLLQRVASDRPNTWVIDAGAGEEVNGHHVSFLPCMAEEQCLNDPSAGMNRVRSPDGLHFCPAFRRATIALLRNCPTFSPGASRFASAWAAAVVARFGL